MRRAIGALIGPVLLVSGAPLVLFGLSVLLYSITSPRETSVDLVGNRVDADLVGGIALLLAAATVGWALVLSLQRAAPVPATTSLSPRRPSQSINDYLVRLLAPTGQRVADRAVDQYFFDIYVREKLHRQEFFFDAFKALRFNGIEGDYAEFGSWGGLTFALAYHESRRRGHAANLWAFDSFQGLPPPKGANDEHPEWKAGSLATSLAEFHANCAANGIPREAYTAVPGFFEETLAAMSSTEEPTNIALAYVDCDLYSSTKAVLAFLEPRLKHGMIVAFDDYFCWSPTQISGERKAMLELVSDDSRWVWTPYVQFGWHGASFVIEDKTSLEA